MKNTVVIKGNKSGMTVILDPEAAYETLLLDIAAKFEESARFWGSVQMTLTLAIQSLRTFHSRTVFIQFTVASIYFFSSDGVQPNSPASDKPFNARITDGAVFT